MILVRTFVFHMLRTYIIILCNWLIFWHALYLYLGRFRMSLNSSRNLVSRSSISSLLKKTSSECKIIKARQLARQLHLSSLRKLFYIRCSRHLLDSCSTPAICRDLRFSEFQYDFLGIRECVCGLSFLLTLDI